MSLFLSLSLSIYINISDIHIQCGVRLFTELVSQGYILFLPPSFCYYHLRPIIIKAFPQRSVLEFHANAAIRLFLQVVNIDEATAGEQSCWQARVVRQQRAQSARLTRCRPVWIFLAIVCRPCVRRVQSCGTSMVICKRKQTIRQTLRGYKSAPSTPTMKSVVKDTK